MLGGRGEAGVDTMSIIYEFNLPGEFAEDVLAESRREAEKFDVLEREVMVIWNSAGTGFCVKPIGEVIS